MFVDISIDAGQRLGVSEGDLTGEAAAAVESILRAIGDNVEEVIYSVWPVDTGRSLRAWRVFTEGLFLVIQNPVEYASWVHPAGTARRGKEELGASAEAIQIEAELGWQQSLSELRSIVRLGKKEAGGLLTRAALSSAAARVAGVQQMPGGELFTSLRDVFTLSSIASRERGRPRGRPR